MTPISSFVLVLALSTSAAQAASPDIPVTSAPVRKVEWPEQISAQGSIVAWQEAVVANRVPGVPVVAIYAEVGDRVKRGTLLARLDDRLLKADLQRAEAERERARLTLVQADIEAKRSQALREGGALSEQELLAAETARELARAQLQAAEASIHALRIKLEDTRLQAPDDGLIVARSAVLGQVPAQGGDLFRLIRQDRLEWRAEVPPDQFARLRIGSAVQLQLPDGHSARGKLRKLAGALESSNRMGLAYVDLSPGDRAKAGMMAAGRFALASRPCLAVPAEAVQVSEGRAVVYRIVGGIARKVVVQIGRREDSEIEVQGALNMGDRVVVLGAGFLRDGERVREMAIETPPSVKVKP